MKTHAPADSQVKQHHHAKKAISSEIMKASVLTLNLGRVETRMPAWLDSKSKAAHSLA